MSDYYNDLTLTSYPNNIDEIEHVNDIDNTTYELANEYKSLIANKNFTGANDLLQANPELAKCGINAGKWNSIADAVMAVERYAKSMKLPIIVSETEPADLIEGGFWIQQIDYLCIIKQLTTSGYVDIYRNDGFNTTTDSSKIGRVGNVGEGSVSFGRNCEASGVCSQAFGQGTKSTGEGSVSFGVGCTTKGSNAITTGTGNSAVGNNSYVGGTSSTSSAKATNSIIYGNGLTSNYENQAVFGKYNSNKNDSLFEVGNGSSTNNKSNAFSVNKNGNATVKGLLSADQLCADKNGVLSLGNINSENNISAKNNITAQGRLSVGNGAKINGGNCELGVGYDFITYEFDGKYERELRSIKYRTVYITVDGGVEGYAWDSNNTINFNLDTETDIPSDATILGIISLKRHPLERWDGFFINYEYLEDIPNKSGSGTHRGICIWTNSKQNYDIELTVLYV